MKVLSAQETSGLLPYTALAEQLRAVLVDKRAGRASAPPRLHVPLAGGGVLLVMPAADEELAITKLVTVHPQNVAQGLPSVQAEVLVFEARTGRRLLWLDGDSVTAHRTAALSLLAAQTLAPNPAGPLLIIGTGVQGRSHLEAMAQGLGVRQVYVTARDPAHATDLAAYARSLGVDAESIARPEEVLDQVSLIVTATTSPEPVLPPEVRADAFITAVGSFQPERAELPAALVQKAQLYVDTVEGARAEAGDLVRASIDWSRVTPLEEAIMQPKPATGPVIFKSVGHALWDLAAARLIWSSLGG
ncbi:MAG TPA: delta(1)-pyrroline-2-carboxylate reductase family protein [Chloroflexia bacterium]|nr:delta(1)-pyrroline-2-carboxylate reductase family protein [Chloroflexia bacterium]